MLARGSSLGSSGSTSAKAHEATDQHANEDEDRELCLRQSKLKSSMAELKMFFPNEDIGAKSRTSPAIGPTFEPNECESDENGVLGFGNQLERPQQMVGSGLRMLEKALCGTPRCGIMTLSPGTKPKPGAWLLRRLRL